MSVVSPRIPSPAVLSPRPAVVTRPQPSFFSNGRVLLPLLLTHLALIVYMWAVMPGLPADLSLVLLSLGCCGAVLFAYRNSALHKALGGTGMGILAAAFVTKVLIGVIHFLTIMDPNYFSHPQYFGYLHDYAWMHEIMTLVSRVWQQHGFLSELPPKFWLENKNTWMLGYNGVLYFFTGPKVLDIAPWNTLHSMYVAIIVAALALRAGATRNQALLALTIAAFQPFGGISSIVWRDSVGQCWIAIAMYLLVITEDKHLLSLVALPAAAFLAFAQREAYFMPIVVVWALMHLVSAGGDRTVRTLLVSGVMVLAAILAVYFNVWELIGSLAPRIQQTAEISSSVSMTMIPLRMLRGIIGPFPWYQIFMVKYWEFLPADFLQHVLNLTIYIIVAPGIWREYKETKRIDPNCVLAGLLLLMAIVNLATHSSYVSIGSVFFLPLACKQGKPKNWIVIFLIVLGVYLMTNLVYWSLGLTGSNLTNTGKDLYQ